jgi:short-subunit dehydrogenase
MQLHDQRVLITGASGGIGRQLALHLASKGAHVALLGRRAEPLQVVADKIAELSGKAFIVCADLTRGEERQAALTKLNHMLGGIDILINNAGATDFSEFATSDPAVVEQIIRTNVIAPMLLTRAILPQMLEQNRGQIVNVGSIFGSIGFACFTAYSASKFAVRGFSEALRRELDGSGVNVTYVAPRAARTGLNTEAVYRMAEAVGMNMDSPERVARLIVKAIEKDRKDCYFGWPESLFVRINSLLPRLVDSALRKQNRSMRGFARDN